ncbi:hypothetical protein [Methanococcus voltae]|uniref:Uncharacterized protein n=2 Tax=Methanococcus voltae TaxID=2188 RepID=D7DQS2_METV3|nr:hypothetical protein [Methanococcus voltae]MCS3900859.1 hypothetical protein [Methanococcus voltae]MCS3922567.1 hypothetical protein [Methanococcus voltae PS]
MTVKKNAEKINTVKKLVSEGYGIQEALIILNDGKNADPYFSKYGVAVAIVGSKPINFYMESKTELLNVCKKLSRISRVPFIISED